MYPHRAPVLQNRTCQSWKPGRCYLVHTRSARYPATAIRSNSKRHGIIWMPFPDRTADRWSSASNSNQVTTPTPWDKEEQESDLPAPPVWLDMLTRVDQRKSSGSLSQVPPSASALEKEAVTVQQPVQQPVVSPPFHPVATPWEQLPVSSSSYAAQEEEEFFFGPEWLKSLGATTMEPLTPQEPELAPIQTYSEEPEPSVSSAPTATFEQLAAWATPSAETEPQVVEGTVPVEFETKKISVENWIEQKPPKKLAHPEQNCYYHAGRARK